MEYIESSIHHPIFQGLDKHEIERIYNCFNFNSKQFNKNEYILLEGDAVIFIGIILHGTVLMEKNDSYGNNYFFTELSEREIFGEPFMSNTLQNATVNYKAMTNCLILFFPYQSIWNYCSINCNAHKIFTQNLMNLLAHKTRTLLAKIEILSKKSLRDRILTFLTIAKSNQDIIDNRYQILNDSILQKNQFSLNLNKTELAEYLGVNRSALVRELARMQNEHIIKIEKNIYTII